MTELYGIRWREKKRKEKKRKEKKRRECVPFTLSSFLSPK